MKKQFKVFSPLTSKSVNEFITKSDEGSDERILLEGISHEAHAIEKHGQSAEK